LEKVTAALATSTMIAVAKMGKMIRALPSMGDDPGC
jgi:hypothetical protein